MRATANETAEDKTAADELKDLRSKDKILYRKSVKLLQKNKYINVDESDIKSFDDKEYICKTCHSEVLEGKIPCQAIYNNIYVDKIPAELASLEKLEQILIAQRIVLKR